jgi:hypothetical protein
MAPPLLSAGAAGVALLSAGGDAIGAAGGGEAAGAALSWLLLHAESTSAAAIALRATFVFIDGSPEVCKKAVRRRELSHEDQFYKVSGPF